MVENLPQAFAHSRVKALPEQVQRAYRALMGARRMCTFAEYSRDEAEQTIKRSLRGQSSPMTPESVITVLTENGFVVVDAGDQYMFLTPAQSEAGEIFAEV